MRRQASILRHRAAWPGRMMFGISGGRWRSLRLSSSPLRVLLLARRTKLPCWQPLAPASAFAVPWRLRHFLVTRGKHFLTDLGPTLFRPLTVICGRNEWNRRNERGDVEAVMGEPPSEQPDQNPLPAPHVPHSTVPTSTPASVPPLPASGSQEAPHAHDSDGTTLHTKLLGDLVVPGAAGRDAEPQALSHRAAIYASRARGDGTRRVYRSAWRGYAAWCQSLSREPLAGDPELLAMYATHRADAGVGGQHAARWPRRHPHSPPACRHRPRPAPSASDGGGRGHHPRHPPGSPGHTGGADVLRQLLVRRSKTDQHGQARRSNRRTICPKMHAKPRVALRCSIVAHQCPASGVSEKTVESVKSLYFAASSARAASTCFT